MQGQSSKVARGLRTVGNNISNLAQEQKTLAIETQNGTRQIQLFDEATGDMRSTYDVLGDIAEQWDNMSNAQKQAIGITLAGKNQFEVMMAVTSNFADAQKAVELATNSENSALNENARYMESIDAKTSLLKSNVSELVLGDGGLTSLIKTLLDVSNAFLSLANSGIGKAVINIGLFYTAILLLSKGFALLQANSVGLSFSILELVVSFTTAETAGKGLLAVLEMLNINPIVLAISALVVTAFALKKAYDGLKTSISDANQTLEESKTELDEEKQKLEDLKNQITEINKERLSVTDEDELRNLDLQKANLEAQLQIQKDITAEKEEQAKKDAEKALDTYGSSSVGFSKRTGSTTEVFGTASQALETQVNDINYLNEKIATLIEKKNDLAETDAEYNALSEHYKKQYDELTEKISAYSSALTEVKGSSAENAQVLQNAIDAGVEDSDVLEELIDKYLNASQASEEVTDSQETQNDVLEQTAEAYGLTAEQVKAYMEANDITDITEACEALATQAENAEDVADAYDDSISAVGSMSSEFGTLNDAINEYNSTGALSLDTISDLLALDNDYLSLLQMENGQMSLNAQGAEALANAKIDDAEAMAIQKAQAELGQIANHEYNSTLVESATASSIAVQSAQSAGQAILASGDDADVAKAKWQSAWETISQGYSFTSKQDKAYSKQIENSLKTQITTLESLRGNLGKVTTATNASTKSTKGNTSATNSNTKALKANLDALKARKEELEDQKKTYDDVISYIEKKLENAIDEIEDKRDEELEHLKENFEYKENKINDEIELLEKERDTIVENIESEIKALKKIKDAEDERVDAEIDRLKYARDAEQEYWQTKIDALKESNDELESQIELEQLLDSLERAKATKKMVYREGRGFVYEQDEEAVSSAEANLQEYYRKKQYEDALKELETYKDNSKKLYDNQIADLENYIEAYDKDLDNQIESLEHYQENVEAEYKSHIENLKANLEAIKAEYEEEKLATEEKYQSQIDYLQGWLDKFKAGVDSYENEQLRQQALQTTGIDFEKKGWDKQLKNLEEFLKKYQTLQAQVTEATNAVTEAQKAYNEATSAGSSSSGGNAGGGGISSGGSSASGSSTTATTNSPHQGMVGRYYSWKKGAQYANLTTNQVGKTTTQGQHTMLVEEVVREGNGTYWAIGTNKNNNRIKIKIADLLEPFKQSLYAKGTYSTIDDEIAIVGDDPQFSELVVGSKLNSGAKILNSSKGTGIIPHNLTSTLVSMAQAFQGQQPLQTTNNSNATTISIGNISLPNVENGEQFVDYLQHFNLDMTNLAYSR